MAYYQAPNPKLWQGRADSRAYERVFQFVECVAVDKARLSQDQNHAYAILGFQSDIGVQRNLGRIGAKDGPMAIRKALANLALHKQNLVLYDVGDIVVDDDDLEAAQAMLAEQVATLLSQQVTPIVLGGGHEVAWGHYQGIAQAYPDSEIGIINFDAHFDLRPLLADDKGSSGTSFLQIANSCVEQHKKFDYLCLGIQPQANTSSLFDTARVLNVSYVMADEMQSYARSSQQLKGFLAKHEHIYLTLCLDVFASSYAPGVSAPQVMGITPTVIKPLLQLLRESGKVLSFDVAELAPNLDRNQMTAALAANLICLCLN